MESIKEDNKEVKAINFHQMELDDRILKVNTTLSLTKQESKYINFISGNSKTRMDYAHYDPGESDSNDP